MIFPHIAKLAKGQHHLMLTFTWRTEVLFVPLSVNQTQIWWHYKSCKGPSPKERLFKYLAEKFYLVEGTFIALLSSSRRCRLRTMIEVNFQELKIFSFQFPKFFGSSCCNQYSLSIIDKRHINFRVSKQKLHMPRITVIQKIYWGNISASV